MPIALTILAALTAAYVWYLRMSAARDAAETLVEAANDVRLAARRFGFRRKMNVHPADSVDDARIAAIGIVSATAQMDRSWDRDMSDLIVRQAQSIFDVGLAEAEELTILGKWLAEQSATKHEIVRRLSKRLATLAGPEALPDLERMVAAVTSRDGGLSENVEEALTTIRRLIR